MAQRSDNYHKVYRVITSVNRPEQVQAARTYIRLHRKRTRDAYGDVITFTGSGEAMLLHQRLNKTISENGWDCPLVEFTQRRRGWIPPVSTF